MPTPVAHFLAGTTIALLSSRKRPLDKKFLAASVVTASFADVDFGISFLIGRNLHHYFTHSVGFALLFAGTVYLLARAYARDRPAFDALVLGVSYLSHLLLDMVSEDTAPPYGLELFWPVSDRFHISPILVFDDIWRGTLAKLFGLHNWLAVAREILIVGPPTALVFLWFRRRQGYSKKPLPLFRPR
jgi:membrane-bound metal-dependent hydrolase YbcI (DUF457 family)